MKGFIARKTESGQEFIRVGESLPLPLRWSNIGFKQSKLWPQKAPIWERSVRRIDP
jgi:hypothetical protein